MPQASGIRKQVAFVAETVFGTTPATPNTQLIEYVSFSGALDTPLLTDPSVRPDRQISYARRGNESVTADLEVVMCADNFDTFLEAALQGTWATNVLKVGNTQRSFAIEEGFTDINQYHTFNGCVINTLSMEVTTDNMVTASFGFIGATETAFSGTSIDTTPTAITAKPKFYHVGGTFQEGGVSVGFLSAISFELNNNLTPTNALGASGVRSITSGQSSITGSVTALFEDAVAYNKFKNNVDSSLQFALSDGTDTMTFLFPKVKYTGGRIQGDGNGPVVVELDFTAIVDPVEATSLKITRT